jgi:hypothetical protein
MSKVEAIADLDTKSAENLTGIWGSCDATLED